MAPTNIICPLYFIFPSFPSFSSEYAKMWIFLSPILSAKSVEISSKANFLPRPRWLKNRVISYKGSYVLYMSSILLLRSEKCIPSNLANQFWKKFRLTCKTFLFGPLLRHRTLRSTPCYLVILALAPLTSFQMIYNKKGTKYAQIISIRNRGVFKGYGVWGDFNGEIPHTQ